MVQDQHKARQAVLWPRGLPEVTENTETTSPILSGTGACTTLSLFPSLSNSLIRYRERDRALCSDKQIKTQDAVDTVSVDPWIKVVIYICVITCKMYILNLNLLIGTCIY